MGKHKGLKLVAYVPVSKTTVAAFGTDYEDTGGAFWIPGTETMLTISQGFKNIQTDVRFAVDFEVYGKGFKYFDSGPLEGRPYAGTIKKVDVFIDQNPAFTVTGLKLSPEEAAKLYQGDPFEAFAKLLTGDDTIIGSEFPDPNLWGGKGNDLLWGRMGNDIVDGFKGNDINDGGLGNDYLIDTKGKDWFQFSTALEFTASANLGYNFDTILKFGKGDEIYLAENVFEGIGGKLSENEFHFGEIATSIKQRILFDGDTGYWDRDGSGTMYEAIPFFEVEKGGGNINHKVFVMGVMYGYDEPY